MILTALLWITLAAAVLFLAIIASPVRFGGSLSYRKTGEGAAAYKLWISYIHPLVYKREYSSENDYQRTIILGFEKKSDVRGGDGNGRDDGYGGARPANTDYKRPKGGGAPGSTGGKPANKDNLFAEDSRPRSRRERANRRAGKDNINTGRRRARRSRHIFISFFSWIDSLLLTIEKYADRVRGHNYYKIISDKPLRKKLVRWLRYAMNGIFTMIFFDSFRLRARVGYGDPAALGKAYGYFIAARQAMELRNHSVDLAMEPVFTEECLDINAEAAGRTTISVILWRLLVIAVTFPYLRLRKVTKTENKEGDLAPAPTSFASPSPAD
ncbi:MAG: hypothetical protein FWB85_12065 [Chitinispirillia bacterium]|nr:hypothetical protein [Chitinispirillia bacterium]